MGRNDARIRVVSIPTYYGGVERFLWIRVERVADPSVCVLYGEVVCRTHILVTPNTTEIYRSDK